MGHSLQGPRSGQSASTTDHPMLPCMIILHDRSAAGHDWHLMLPLMRNCDENWRVKQVQQVAHPSDSLLSPVFAVVEEACPATSVVFHVSCLHEHFPYCIEDCLRSGEPEIEQMSASMISL